MQGWHRASSSCVFRLCPEPRYHPSHYKRRRVTEVAVLPCNSSTYIPRFFFSPTHAHNAIPRRHLQHKNRLVGGRDRLAGGGGGGEEGGRERERERERENIVQTPSAGCRGKNSITNQVTSRLYDKTLMKQLKQEEEEEEEKKKKKIYIRVRANPRVRARTQGLGLAPKG